MSTKLHINAYHPGDYRGVSANISGEGFAGMSFKVKATNQEQYDAWLKEAKNSIRINLILLTIISWHSHLKIDRQIYRFIQKLKTDLYDKVIMKYMSPP
jgi:cytochrome o ubiquinol oxidase subunit 2